LGLLWELGLEFPGTMLAHLHILYSIFIVLIMNFQH
jgi:hypothetical protein